MTETENNKDLIEKITNGTISYLNFVEKIKQIMKDDIIQSEPNDNSKSKYSYIFRDFNLDCYIIKKNYFDDFRSSIDFNVLIEILKPINDENIKKFKDELKKNLDKKPYEKNGENIKIYSDEEELKEIMKNNNYALINKELLCDVMGVPELQLENNKLKLSKNENNTSLFSVLNNFMMTIHVEGGKEKIEEEKENKEYKNLYYVGDITKKILILLYFYEEKIKNKIKSKIKDVYKFKKYYLINSSWLNEYKEFFSYDIIKKKLDKKYKDYSYNRIKTELNNISKKDIGQIKLYGGSIASNNIRDTSILMVDNNKIKTKNYESSDSQSLASGPEIKFFDIPEDFELINEDIFELLMKEEFFYNMNEDVKNKISYDVLLGNNQIIIKNKLNEKNIEIYKNLNNYLFYVNNENNDNNNKNEKYILKYMLNYDKNDIFFIDLKSILEKGINIYINHYTLDTDKESIKLVQKIQDQKKKELGEFINVGINEEDIENNFKYKIIIENNDKNSNNNNEKNIEIKENINTNNTNNNNYTNNNNIGNTTMNNDTGKINNQNENNLSKSSLVIINKNKISDSQRKNNNDSKSTDYSFEKLKIKIKLLEPFFNLLFMIITNNKEGKNIEINKLIEGEILKKINNNDLPQIILIKENTSNFLNLDLIYKYINSNEEKKNELLKENQEEFKNINKKLKNTESDYQELSIIQNYNDVKNNMNNKYYVLNKNLFKDIFKNIKDVYIYYFISNDKKFIFFEKEEKILQLTTDSDFDKNGLYILNNYDMEIKECLDIINSQILFNKDINNIYIYNEIKEYYLMNKNWIRIKMNEGKKNIRISMNNKHNYQTVNEKPEIKTDLDYLEYPINFEFIDKEYYESIINNLGRKDNKINIENFLTSKMFFVNWQNNIPEEQLKSFNKIYIGLIDNEHPVIYFYLINNKEYSYEFLLQFYEEKIMYEEIKNSIKRKGVGQYIHESIFDFSNNGEDYILINYDLKEIGLFINFNNNIDIILFPQISKCMKYIEAPFFYNGVLQCLSNIKDIKIFFLKRNDLTSIIEENSIFTKYLYQIIQDLWYWNEEDKSNIINNNFIKEIKKSVKFNNSNCDNIALLIKNILLNIHNESKTDKERNKIKNNYTKLDGIYQDLKDMNDNFYSINNSIIQKLFFFKLESKYYCNSCKTNDNHYNIECLLEFDFEKIKKNLTIYTLLEYLNEDIKCPNCNNSNRLIKKFISIPQYLIIIIKRNEKCDFHFKLEENIEIKNYIGDKDIKNMSSYTLISFIKNNLISLCKSSIDNQWYKYNYKQNNIEKCHNIIEDKTIPYLLIYKNDNNE